MQWKISCMRRNVCKSHVIYTSIKPFLHLSQNPTHNDRQFQSNHNARQFMLIRRKHSQRVFVMNGKEPRHDAIFAVHIHRTQL
jgi:hypothetical protein